MDALEVFERYASQPHVRERVANVITVPGREPALTDAPTGVSSKLMQRLPVERFYSHQAEAIASVMGGRDTMVVTGTGSGKSLCYNVPVLDACLTEPVATALYLFPTKALAQDQAAKLVPLAGDVRVGVYDGDTPRAQRSAIRKSANIVVTNPDMAHIGILPRHEDWSRFLRALRYIVIDEAHTYRGAFGSHVGGVLRRLLRLSEWYGSRPVVVACSATVGNPQELFGKLTGREAHIVASDGAAQSERNIVLVAPPSLEEDESFSPNMETAALLAEFVRNGVRTLAFCRARVSTELVVRYARKALEDSGHDFEQVESYRGGYTPKERRDIETRLFKGSLTGLATTNAMELGVDVGGLDAIVLNGYPGSLSSFWQQVGRAGRGTGRGFAVMVGHEDPMEHYLTQNPGVLLGQSERVPLDPQNSFVLGAQLRCAAYERPLSAEDLARFGENAGRVADQMDDAGDLRWSSDRYFYPSHEPPARKVDIRGTGGEGVRLYCDGEPIGEMERWRALQSAHKGAVYLHRTATYVVERLDLKTGEAILKNYEPGYFTQAIVQSVVQPTVDLDEQGSAALCGMSVTSAVMGFRKLAQDGRQVLGEEALDLPPLSFDTVGVRFALGPEWSAAEGSDTIGAVHGAEHALMAVAPVLAACDRRDLGSAWFSVDPKDLEASIYVFDTVPGGMGLCEGLFALRREWTESALRLLEGCRCEAGCPLCLYSPQCEAMNEHLSKLGTIKALTGMLDRL